MAKVIPIFSIICDNIKPLKATEQRIALDRINLFSGIQLRSSDIFPPSCKLNKKFVKPIFANLRIMRHLCLFKSSKFNEEKFLQIGMAREQILPPPPLCYFCLNGPIDRKFGM